MIKARFYYQQDTHPLGPFTGQEIAKFVACEKLDRETPISDQQGNVCAAGKVLADATPLTPPPPPMPAPPLPPQDPANRRNKPPWHPAILGVLGLLFTPLWTGVMTALNARRVGLTQNMDWRWLALGIGWLVADLILTMTPWNFYLTHLALYATATGLIWYFAVRQQYKQYKSNPTLEFSRAPWTIPVVAGLPFALLVTFLGVVVPLLPDTPREVCENMLAASDENRSEYLSEELKLHETDMNWIVQKIVGDCTLTEGYLLSAAEMAKSELAEGCFVDFEMKCMSGSQETTCAGSFHLVLLQKRWKIKEMCFMQIADHKQEGWVPFSEYTKEIREIIDPPPPKENIFPSRLRLRPFDFPLNKNPNPYTQSRKSLWEVIWRHPFTLGRLARLIVTSGLLLFLGGLVTRAVSLFKRNRS